jgi:hypothetical protein
MCIHEFKSGQDTMNEAIHVISDSIIHITKAITQFRKDIDKSWENNRAKNHSNFIQELIHDDNTSKIYEANDSNAPNFTVSEFPHQSNTNVTSQQKNPSTNTLNPKHLVPCPFLRRKVV